MSKVSPRRLGDLITLKRGYDLPEKDRVPGPYPVISSAGVSGVHHDYKVEGPGVVTGRYGTLGEMYFVDGKYWPHNTALYVQNFKGNDPKYIYYLLSCLGRIRTSDKSAVPGVNRNELHEMAIPAIDDKKLQISIRKVLEAIDQKIELNNRINAELEAMAKILYDYWFVQFDYPDANGKPYKTSGGEMVYNPTLKREIPLGWDAVSVGRIVDIKTGKEDANYATENGKYHFFTCGESALRCDNFAFEGKAVLLAGNGSFSVKRYEGKFNAYQRTYVLIPKQDDLYAPLYFAVNDKVKTLTSGSRGSIVKFITKGDIEDIYLPLPANGKLEFVKTLNACFKKSSKLYEQNLELVTLRDWLLPMLMNGQVTVK